MFWAKKSRCKIMTCHRNLSDGEDIKRSDFVNVWGNNFENPKWKNMTYHEEVKKKNNSERKRNVKTTTKD